MKNMPPTDQELELLEAYLDGELSTGQEDALRKRLADEPLLATAMENARAERQVRLAVWKSFEPDTATVARLVQRVDASVDRNTIWAARLSKLRIASSVAACVVFGVLIGRIGNVTDTGRPASNGSPLISTTPVSEQLIPAGTGEIPTIISAAPQVPLVEIPIVDESGRKLGVQRFNTAQEASQFLEDLSRWQSAQDQVKASPTTAPQGK